MSLNPLFDKNFVVNFLAYETSYWSHQSFFSEISIPPTSSNTKGTKNLKALYSEPICMSSQILFTTILERNNNEWRIFGDLFHSFILK